MVMGRGGTQHTDPAEQSEHTELFRRRGGTKQSVTDRLRREELQC